jgi:hypothetical protein
VIELLLLWLVCAVALLGAVCAALVGFVALVLWMAVVAFEAITGDPA